MEIIHYVCCIIIDNLIFCNFDVNFIIMLVEIHFEERQTETLTLADESSIKDIVNFLDDYYGKNQWNYYLNGI